MIGSNIICVTTIGVIVIVLEGICYCEATLGFMKGTIQNKVIIIIIIINQLLTPVLELPCTKKLPRATCGEYTDQ